MSKSFSVALARIALAAFAALLLTGQMVQAATFQIDDEDVAALITALETAADGDVVSLAEDGTYTLTAVHNTRNGPNGLPVVSHDIELRGNGATIRRDSGAPEFRLLYLEGVGPGMEITDLTIEKGYLTLFNGGGLYLENSSPTITDCTFRNNFSRETGGGMFNVDSDPTILGCTFDGNGKGAAAWETSWEGGGMANLNSDPVITECIFRDNWAMSYGGGMSNRGSSPTLTSCIFEENVVDGEDGGGIFNFNSNAMIKDCSFASNRAHQGGGIMNQQSSPTISDCTFVANWANGGGGGIWNSSSNATIVNTTFRENAAHWEDGDGGGLLNHLSDSTVIDCTFEGNTASMGGGVMNGNSSPTFTNVVFIRNEALHNGGGMVNRFNSETTATDSAFQKNTASRGGGIFSEADSSSKVGATFFCENSPAHIDGPWEDLGFNRFSDTCESSTDALLADLIAEVHELDLHHGLTQSLTAQLSAALRDLERANERPAANKLNAFINKVSAQTGKKIAPNDALYLTEAAHAIIDRL